MPVDIVDRAYLSIDGQEYPCSSIDWDTDDGTKEVEAMTRDNRAIGFAGGNVKFKLTAECAVNTDNDGVFEEAHLARTEFSAVIENEGSKTRSFFPCRISKVSGKAKVGSEITYNLDIVALDMTVG